MAEESEVRVCVEPEILPPSTPFALSEYNACTFVYYDTFSVQMHM